MKLKIYDSQHLMITIEVPSFDHVMFELQKTSYNDVEIIGNDESVLLRLHREHEGAYWHTLPMKKG